MFGHSERIILIVDGANMSASARALNFTIDYKKLKAEFEKRGTLIDARFYSAVVDAHNTSITPTQIGVRRLTDWLEYNGYSVVRKKAKTFINEGGELKVKGNMDGEMIVDMFERCDYIDHIYLFTGDGDFVPVVESMQRRGKKITVISTVESQPHMAADELRRACVRFLDLKTLIPKIARVAE